METREQLLQLWPQVRPILLPYEGLASQIYVLDVPRTELERAIDSFCRRSMDALITMLDGIGFGTEEQRICDLISRADILKASKESRISGKFYRDRSIQFWVWPSQTGTHFDAELVFFADEFFPDSKEEEEQIESFSSVYSLAEDVRKNNPECECVLSGSETGDPRDHRNEPWTVFW